MENYEHCFQTCHHLLICCVLGKSSSQRTFTHVDVLQVQEVQYDAVPLPDDGWAQRPLDGAGQDGAEAHGYRGDADPLVLRQAQLHNLC